jgi:hypothetical protein
LLTKSNKASFIEKKVDEYYTGGLGQTLARQFQGFTPNNYHILWACQIFGVAGVGCKPNILIIPSEREMSYCN